jgi:hypothetical protein
VVIIADVANGFDPDGGAEPDVIPLGAFEIRTAAGGGGSGGGTEGKGRESGTDEEVFGCGSSPRSLIGVGPIVGASSSSSPSITLGSGTTGVNAVGVPGRASGGRGGKP